MFVQEVIIGRDTYPSQSYLFVSSEPYSPSGIQLIPPATLSAATLGLWGYQKLFGSCRNTSLSGVADSIVNCRSWEYGIVEIPNPTLGHVIDGLILS